MTRDPIGTSWRPKPKSKDIHRESLLIKLLGSPIESYQKQDTVQWTSHTWRLANGTTISLIDTSKHPRAECPIKVPLTGRG